MHTYIDRVETRWTMCEATADCRGVAYLPYGTCLAHLSPDQLPEVLRSHGIDARGTVISRELLARLLEVATWTGRARFDHAVFAEDAVWGGVRFAGDASFDHARFAGMASFADARFDGNGSFHGVRFCAGVSFYNAEFSGYAAFEESLFARDAVFGGVHFRAGASFRTAVFGGVADFDGVHAGGTLTFHGARFRRTLSVRNARFDHSGDFDSAAFAEDAWLGPIIVGDRMGLVATRAGQALNAHITGGRIECARARFAGPVTISLTGTRVDLAGTVFDKAARVHGRSSAPHSKIVSLEGCTAGHLTLSGLDASSCLFTGLVRPDRLSIGESLAFARLPGNLWRRSRTAIADELAWLDRPDPRKARSLAAVYHHLGQSVDGPLSADFRYAAMDITRRAVEHGSRRWVLGMYWLFLGYGLRLRRGLIWLLVLTAAITGALAFVGHSRAHGRSVPPVQHARPTPSLRG